MLGFPHACVLQVECLAASTVQATRNHKASQLRTLAVRRRTMSTCGRRRYQEVDEHLNNRRAKAQPCAPGPPLPTQRSAICCCCTPKRSASILPRQLAAHEDVEHEAKR